MLNLAMEEDLDMQTRSGPPLTPSERSGLPTSLRERSGPPSPPEPDRLKPALRTVPTRPAPPAPPTASSGPSEVTNESSGPPSSPEPDRLKPALRTVPDRLKPALQTVPSGPPPPPEPDRLKPALQTVPSGPSEVTNEWSGPREPVNEWSGGWPQSREEFGRLVDAYLGRLVRYAFRRVGNLPDAEDVVQEVFVRAYADREKRARIAMPGPYLYKMTANACVSHLRTRSRSAVPLETSLAETIPTHIPDPSQAAVALEELRRAEELIRHLPEKQAEVVRLRVFDELRLHEIAEIIGCSKNTVAARLRYGFRKLREIVARKRRFGL